MSVFLAVAYATLPLWLPTGWLGRQLSEQLAADLQRPVRIERVRIGWIDGVIFENITIAGPPSEPDAPLARIGRIRTGFDPLSTAITNRVDRIEIVQPQLWLRVDETGKVTNLPELEGRRTGRLPSLYFIIQKAACHIVASHVEETYTVDRIEMRLDPRTGLLRLLGSATVQRPQPRPPLTSVGRLNLDARVIVTRLRRDRALRGNIRIDWSDMALSDLPLRLAPNLPIQQVDGSTTGQLTLAPQPDLGVDFNLFIDFNRVKVVRAGLDRPAQVPDAQVRCDGHWDPNTDAIVLNDFQYDTPAIHVARPPKRSDPALSIDPKGDSPFALHLAGTIKDWLALRREFPEVDTFVKGVGATLAGSAEFAIALTQQRTQDRFELSVDGMRSDWRLAGTNGEYLVAGIDVPKSLELEVLRHRRTRRLSQPRVQLRLGDLTMALKSELVLPDPEPQDKLLWLREILPTLRSELTVKTDHMEEVLKTLPFLQQQAGITDARGPMQASISLSPAQNTSCFEFTANLGPQSVFSAADAFIKSAGLPLSFRFGAVLPHTATGRLDQLWMELAGGNARVILDRQAAGVDYRFAFLNENDDELSDRPIAVDASCTLPLRIDHIEDLLALFPRWQQVALSEVALAGSLSLELQSSVSYRPQDWLLRSTLRARTDELAIRWADQIDKPAGMPLLVTLSHRLQQLAAAREHALAVNLTHPAGEISGSIAFAGGQSREPGDDFETENCEVRIDDLAAFIAFTPALHRLLEPYHPTGPLDFRAASIRTGDRQTVSLSADATGAAFVVPGEPPFVKPAGTPAKIVLTGRAEERAGNAREQSWTLEAGHLELPGASVKTLSGELITGWQPGRRQLALPSLRLFAREGPIPILQSAGLRAAGTIRFDDALADIHPDIRRIVDEYKLAGDCGYDAHIALEPHAIVIDGRVDAGRTAASISLQNPVCPTLRKGFGTPVTLAFDLGIARSAHPGISDINVRNVTLDLGGNAVSTHGTLAAQPEPGRPPQIRDVALTTSLRLADAVAVAELLPGGSLAPLGGNCDAMLSVTRDGERYALGPGNLRFDNFALRTPADSLRLDGEVNLAGNTASADQLHWTWGPSSGVISGVVREENGGKTGRLGVVFDHLDLVDLQQRLTSISAASQTRPADDAEQAANVRRVLAELSKSNLNIACTLGTLQATLPLNVKVLVDAATGNVVVSGGRIDATFRSIVDGGAVNGTFESDISAPDPTFHLAYSAERIQSGSLVDRYLSLTFPGMKATGPLTLIDESTARFLPAPDDPNYPTGKGEIIIAGGTVEGRAAPEWLARIFPGLNIAQFEFSYMHSWFEKLATGRTHHVMIYQGRFYNVYMIGYSDADGRINYEVGIDFLADFSSKYWSEVGQGRVPLFNKTGLKLPDGTLTDEQVNFVPPQRILDTVLIKNNPVFTAYHAVRKRVMKEQ